MSFRKTRDLGFEARDAVFAGDGTDILALDGTGEVWHVGPDGARTRICDGEQIRAAVHAAVRDRSAAARDRNGHRSHGDVRRPPASRPLPPTPTGKQILWHRGSRWLIVHVDYLGWWYLVGRRDGGPWRVLLSGSLIMSYPRSAWSPDGTQIAVLVDPGAAVVDLVGPAGRDPRIVAGETWAWTPDGQLLVVDLDTEDRWVLVEHHPATGRRTVRGELSADVTAWGFPPPADIWFWDGATAIAATDDSYLILYPDRLVWYARRTLTIRHVAGLGAADPQDLTVTGDHKVLIVTHRSGIRLWDLDTAEPLTPVEPSVGAAKPAPTGRHFLCPGPGPYVDSGPRPWSLWELD